MRKAEKRWNLLDRGLLAAVLAVLVGGAWLMRAKPWKRARLRSTGQCGRPGLFRAQGMRF